MKGAIIKTVLVAVMMWTCFLIQGCDIQPVPNLNSKGSALTPPMGWNSWNAFGKNIDETLLRQVADAMTANGMRDAGYRYINIDDGWALPERVKGHLQPDPKKFPTGFKPMTDYLHSKGFKFGIYADRGTRTCVAGSPGSYDHEIVDAADFAAWGVDYLKYDNCHPAFFASQEGDYRRMRDALASTGRPIVFSICAWQFKDWMPELGQLWRTTDDITDDWGNILRNIDQNERYARWAGPGHWNDPDMLVVGCYNIPDLQHGPGDRSELVGNRGLTDVEFRAHFSMWAIMAAPLLAGNDVTNMTSSIRDILLNREVISVDQDTLGQQGRLVWTDSKGGEIYSKKLSGKGQWAIALFNRTDNGRSITANWKDIGIPAGSAQVRDLWKHSDLGFFKGSFKAYVNSHEVVLLMLTALSAAK